MRLKNHVVNLLLMTLAVLLGVYLFVIDRGATTGESQARTRNVFPVFRRGDLSTIEIANGHDEFRLVQRKTASGEVLYDLESRSPSLSPSASAGEPAREPADMGAVAKLLSELELGVRERTIDPSGGAVDSQSLGLEGSRMHIDLSMGQIHYRLIVGAQAPSPSGAAYARIEGERAPFVIRRDLALVLEQPRDRYRTKALLPYLASELSDLTFRGTGPERHLRRTEAGLRIETDRGWVRVERTAGERIIATLADLRAETFFGLGDAEKAIAEAGDRLSVELVPREASQPKAILEIGGPCQGQEGRRLALRRQPEPRVAGCIPESVWEPLTQPVDRLADLHLFSMHPDEVEELQMQSGDQRLEMARSGVSWHMRFPNDTTVEADTGNALARRLTEMVAEGFASAELRGSFAAKAKLSLVRVGDAAAGPDAGESSHVVEVDDTDRGGLVLVRRADDGAVLSLPRNLARDLFPSPLAVRSPTVLEIPLARVRGVQVEVAGVRQALTRSSAGEWSFEEPKGFSADSGLANEIAAALGNLRADRWLAEAVDTAYGFETPYGRIEIRAEAPDGGVHTERVVLGASTVGGRYARKEGDSSVFVLPAAVERTCTTFAIDRSSFLLDLAGVREVKIRRGIDQFTFRWPGEDGKAGERTLVVKGGERVNPRDTERNLAKQNERLAKLREAFSDLLAEAAVHTGVPRKDEGFEHPQMELWIERPAESGRDKTVHLTVGAGDVFRGTRVYYVRRDGILATFAVAQSRLRPLFELP